MCTSVSFFWRHSVYLNYEVFSVVLKQSKTLCLHRVSQMPTTMEQLLEHQWEQGSEFLMQQGQHFDSEYLYFDNCLIHSKLFLRQRAL